MAPGISPSSPRSAWPSPRRRSGCRPATRQRRMRCRWRCAWAISPMCRAGFRSKSTAKSSARSPPAAPRSSRTSRWQRRRWRLSLHLNGFAHHLARRLHRLDDVLIAGAAAQVRGEHVDKVLVADVQIFLQHVRCQHQKTRRAIAALQAVIVDEGLLQHRQLVAVGKALDGADFLALRLNGEHQAGAHRLVVDNYGTGAADAVLAADMGASLAAIVADGVDQRLARLDADRIIAAVDGERDVELFGHALNAQPRGSTSENLPRTSASTSSLDRTTIGNVSRRLNGLQASITTRALRGSSLP